MNSKELRFKIQSALDAEARKRGFGPGRGVGMGAGQAKDNYERLVSHFGKEKANKMIKELGEAAAYAKLPPRGNRLK